MQLGARLSSEKLYERMKLNKPNTCCSVIYTVSNNVNVCVMLTPIQSGTTGTPKGVMLSHDNVCCDLPIYTYKQDLVGHMDVQ